MRSIRRDAPTSQVQLCACNHPLATAGADAVIAATLALIIRDLYENEWRHDFQVCDSVPDGSGYLCRRHGAVLRPRSFRAGGTRIAVRNSAFGHGGGSASTAPASQPGIGPV